MQLKYVFIIIGIMIALVLVFVYIVPSSSKCKPDCTNKLTDGCGGQCVCKPNCILKPTGADDGCGGKCPKCVPDCTNKSCDDNDGCGGNCNSICKQGSTCIKKSCYVPRGCAIDKLVGVLSSCMFQDACGNDGVKISPFITDYGYQSTPRAFYDLDYTGKYNYFCRGVGDYSNPVMLCANNDTIKDPKDQYSVIPPKDFDFLNNGLRACKG